MLLNIVLFNIVAIGTLYLENGHGSAKTVLDELLGANVFIRKSDSLDQTCKDPTQLINFKNHCGFAIDDGGWQLVRHAPKGTTWHSSTDKLNGIDTYGDASKGPEGDEAWSVDFETSMPDYDELLLASGNCKDWLILDRQQINRGTGKFSSLIHFFIYNWIRITNR